MDASGLEERIGTLLAQHREELEQLLDQALERELNQLVEQRLAATNGTVEHGARGPTTDDARTAPAETTRVCEGCGETKPEAAFEKHRRRCRDCRRRDRRNTPQPEPAEPGRPAAIPIAELRKRARVDTRLAPSDLGDWLIGGGWATETPAGLVATAQTIELAGAID